MAIRRFSLSWIVCLSLGAIRLRLAIVFLCPLFVSPTPTLAKLPLARHGTGTDHALALVLR